MKLDAKYMNLYIIQIKILYLLKPEIYLRPDFIRYTI